MKKSLILLLTGLLLVFGVGCSNTEETQEEDSKVTLTIAAAASLTDAFGEIEPMFEAETGIDLDFQFAGSGTLREQVKNGAPIDVFFSASKKYMDEVLDGGFVEESKVLLNNQLVLVKSKDSSIESIDDLSSVEYIAIGNPDSVPAGRYAKEAMENLGIYSDLESKLTLAKDVSQVLSWVEQGNAEAGFVYHSDFVRSDGGVDLVEEIDDSNYTKIVYPIGVVKASKYQDESKEFIDYLSEKDAKEIFEKYGFIVVE